MVITGISLALCLILGAFGIISGRITLSEKTAAFAKRLLLAFSLAGALISLLSLIIYVLIPSGNAEFSKQSFLVLAGRVALAFAVCFFVTLVSSLLKTRLSSFILFIVPMWSAILLFITAFCGYVLSFSDSRASVFFFFFGAGLSLFLFLPSYAEVKRRADVLCDKEKRSAIIEARRSRKLKRSLAKSKRKSLREKKRRLSHPKK